MRRSPADEGRAHAQQSQVSQGAREPPIASILTLSFVVAVWSLLPALAMRIDGLSRRPGFLPLTVWALAGVAVAAPDLRKAILAGYPDDSLFTLTPFQQSGVVAITSIMGLAGVLAVFFLARRISARVSRPIMRLAALLANLALAAIGFTAAFVVMPQVFYAYYRSFIPGLPDQWGVQGGYQFDRLGEALALGETASLAASATGVLFWAVIGLTLSVHVLAWTSVGRQVTADNGRGSVSDR